MREAYVVLRERNGKPPGFWERVDYVREVAPAGDAFSCLVAQGLPCRYPARFEEGRRGSALLPAEAWQDLARRLGLTPIEMHIVQEVFDDRPRKAIAARLDMTGNTLNTHFERLYRKIGVSSQVELVVRVFQEVSDSPPVSCSANTRQRAA